MASPSGSSTPGSVYPLTFQGAVVGALALVALYFGRDFLIPLATSALLVCLLAPAVRWLMRNGLVRPVAVGLVSTVAFLFLAALAWLLFEQASRLGREMPKYEKNLREKVVRLKQPDQPSSLGRLAGMIENLGREISRPVRPVAMSESPPGEGKPVPVEVKKTQESPWVLMAGVAGAVFSPLGVAGVVALVAVASLLYLDDLLERVTKAVNPRNPQAVAAALVDASARVTRYLWMQVVVNVTYGIPVGLGLFWIGVPNALMWGILATLLRFIPFIGPWIAALFPIAMALMVDDGWDMVLWTVGLFVVMELISNNVVEVILYGTSTGVSTVALVVSAFFWTWMWGLGGLALATPMTVMLMVIGRHYAPLQGLSLLLSRDPAWTPAERFESLLGRGDDETLQEFIEGCLKENSLNSFLDQIYLPTLVRCERFPFHCASTRIQRLNRMEMLLHGHSLRGMAGRWAPEAKANYRSLRGLVLSGKSRAEEIAGQALRLAVEASGASVVEPSPPVSFESAPDYLNHNPVDFVVVVVFSGSLDEVISRKVRRLTLHMPWTRHVVMVLGGDETDTVRAHSAFPYPQSTVVTSLEQWSHDILRGRPLDTERTKRLGTVKP